MRKNIYVTNEQRDMLLVLRDRYPYSDSEIIRQAMNMFYHYDTNYGLNKQKEVDAQVSSLPEGV